MTAREGLEKARSFIEAERQHRIDSFTIGGDYATADESEIGYLAEVDDALAAVTDALATLSAPAPDEVVLRVRWEDHPAGHASVLWFGPYRCGEIWRIKDRWYAMTNAAVIERDGYSDRAAAQAALVERAKGGLTW